MCNIFFNIKLRKEKLRALIPKIVEIHPKSFKIIANEGDDLIEKAVSWFKNDIYTKIKRFKKIRWLGKTIFKYPYYASIISSYFKPSNDIVEVVKEMQSLKIISVIHTDSTILETGCNVGRNLYYLQNEYNCNVVGIDISERVIYLAKNKIWKGRNKFKFHIENVLTTDYFNNLEDNTFDLVITRWHLIHIPLTEEKRKYIDSLKRVGKVLIILEPVREGCNEIQLYQGGTYCLSWDNWVIEYGLREYNSKLLSLFDSGTKVFYYNKEGVC